MTTKSISTIHLPADLADDIQSRIQSGEYASETEVIRAGLESLSRHDRETEEWLQASVLPTLQHAAARPDRLIEASEAWDRIENHILQSIERKRRPA